MESHLLSLHSSLLFRRMQFSWTRLPGLLFLFLTPLVVRRAEGQYLTRPAQPWRTVSTAHFDVHFPASMAAWAEPVAQRMEAVATAVNALVGNAPSARVTVMVEDPSNVSNGFALPFLAQPVMFLWPTPPNPSPSFGAHRGWGEILQIHEYAHLAHLTFPSRNPNDRRLWRFLPVGLGPVARKTPAWVFEGYATYIEGVVTGNGRPNSAGRAAVLRQWALEGKFPRYEQLDNSGPFLGGAMRYLVGSAFLEWLVRRNGDESLNHLWRRMSARQSRTFTESFTGVFGAPPADLYGLFLVDVTERALEARRRLRAGGIVQGELFQRLRWATGDPALSKGGSHLAIALRSPSRPSRVVVWTTSPDTSDYARRERAIARAQRLDPLDVPAIDPFPPPRRTLATLHPVGGRGFDAPRWFADGRHILVSRDVPLGDGASRPDLFIWDWQGSTVRRVTRGAAIRSADPSPDGTQAAGVRCLAGVCDIVLVDVASGAVRTLVSGTPDVTWHRPRWSPDGATLAASRHSSGRWNVALISLEDGSVRDLPVADSVNRHSPAFLGSNALLLVSEAGGVPNLEQVSIDGTVSAVTRVTGAVLAPEAASSSQVYFLALHAQGYDLRRIENLSTVMPRAARVIALDSLLYPAAPPRVAPRDSLPRSVSAVSRPYGLGPRRSRLLPGLSLGPDGDFVSVMAGNVDPAGRLGIVAQGAFGSAAAWHGASVVATLRTLPVELEGALWSAVHRPSQQHGVPFTPRSADARSTGGGIIARRARDLGMSGYTLGVGVSAAQLEGASYDGAARTLAFAEAAGRRAYSSGGRTLSARLSVHATAGTTAGSSWTRTLVSGGASLATFGLVARVDATTGRVTSVTTVPPRAERPDEVTREGRAYEQFFAGGVRPPLFDPAFLSQRLSLPAVPVGLAGGDRIELYRVSVGGFPLDPYMIWVGPRSDGGYARVAGLEWSFSIPSLGFVALPAVQARAGAGYSFDDPFRQKTRAYLSVLYRP